MTDEKKNWKVNDVVQINPAHDARFGGCFLLVEEVKSWGVLGFVQIPGNAEQGGQAYYRLPWNGGDYVGKAVFILGNRDGET